MTVQPDEKNPNPILPWAALICGVLSWPLSPFVPIGLDIAAIVLGLLALKQTSKDLRKERLMAHVGLWAGLVRLIAGALTLLWVFLAFARNPVAH